MAQAATGKLVINTRDFYRQVDTLARRYNTDAKTVMRDQHRLYVQDLQKRTPAARRGGGLPASLKKASASKYKDPIERSLRKLFVPVRDIGALRAMEKAFGPRLERKQTTGTVTAAFDVLAPNATVQDLQAQHRRYRTGTRGRVKPPAGGPFKLGHTEWARKMHVKQATYRRYLRQVKRRAGYAKSGWNFAIRVVGGRIQAGYVSRHHAPGMATIRAGQDSIVFSGTNMVPWASDFKRLYWGAERARQRDVQRHLEKRLQKRANEAT